MWKYVLKRLGLLLITTFSILSLTDILLQCLPLEAPRGNTTEMIAFYNRQVALGYFERVAPGDKGYEAFIANPEAANFKMTLTSGETVFSYKTDEYEGIIVGYLHYYGFGDMSDLVPALRYFYQQKIDELILDLRFNNGGYVSTCRYLCNCIVPEIGYGDVFQYSSYNDILSAEYERESGSRYSFEYFGKASDSVETLGTPVIGLKMKRLFVLVSGRTASASEALIVCLRPYMPVITIGETTTGKGTGMWPIQDNEKCRYILNPLTLRYHGKDGSITPETGIVPDYFVKNEDSGVSESRMGNIEEPLYAKAIELITENQ